MHTKPQPLPPQPQVVSKVATGGLRGVSNVEPLKVGVGVDIRPQVFLLFMVYYKINNQAIWDKFLEGGTNGYDFQALVHCKEESRCRKEISSKHFSIIPSVRTEYCLDLVGGMNALLKAAIQRGGVGSKYDKFVLLSDSTLPAKPFQSVYTRLTSHSQSDFCVFPRNEWAEVSEGMPSQPNAIVKLAVKHHQWIVFGRRHAEAAVQNIGVHMNLMQTLQLNLGYSNTGCLDEFWHFTVAYPDLHLTTKATMVNLEDFNGGPLKTSEYEPQGQCDTFVHWVQRASGIHNNVTLLAKELQSDAGTDMMPPSDARPASIRRLSKTSLLAIRESDFLFIRKVVDEAEFSGCEKLDEAFSELVFAPVVQDLPLTTRVWRGEGVWMDNRNQPVAISSMSGATRLVGTGDEMQATGYYCGNFVKFTFNSGYVAKATLAVDGKSLQWDNGVVWPRAANPDAAQHLKAAAAFQMS